MLAPTSPSTLKAAVRPERTDIYPRQWEEKISRIDALQIELIGAQITERIASNLGASAKAAIENRGTTAQYGLLPLALQKMCADMEAKKVKSEFLSDENNPKLQAALLFPIKQLITERFSTPAAFLEDGLSIRLSYFEPEKILVDAAKQIGLTITENEVPTLFVITLRLAKDLSEKQDKLVFTLRTTSNYKEISLQNFTIEELEKNYATQLGGA